MPEYPTIYALSSGSPPAAIGVVRISGPRAGPALEALHGRLPVVRRATLGALRDPATGDILDRALLLWMPGPATATGEDSAEMHLHGGRAVTAAVLAALGRVVGLRLAEPGEFTRRAFLNGIIDLPQAEGLADLIAAETEAERRNAQSLAGGALSRRVEAWRGQVLGLSAHMEATLDFADEDDVAEGDGVIVGEAAALVREMEAVLARPPAERLRDGIRVVIAGPPNAGKSTLLNAIAGREAAITSPQAGTTRDLIEVPLAIAGRPFLFIDTAGLREGGAGSIEQLGIAKAEVALAAADILLWLGSPEEAPEHRCRLIVHAQADLAARRCTPAGADLACSAITGEGIAELVDRISAEGRMLLPQDGELALNARQRSGIAECILALDDVSDRDAVIAAEGLRCARAALDRLTGRAGTEEMLDSLFGQFCIGK